MKRKLNILLKFVKFPKTTVLFYLFINSESNITLKYKYSYMRVMNNPKTSKISYTVHYRFQA